MRGECQIPHGIDGKFDVRGADAAIADLAERQHGVVARAQLDELGMGRGAIEWRLRNRRLHRVHQNVYAVGHRVLSVRGRWMAAVLAAGPGAVLSHRDAGALLGLRASAGGLVEVTAPRRHNRPGLRIHRADLAPDEVTEVDGIPVTTVARTLLDLAAVLPRAQVERAIERAEALGLADTVSLDALLQRHRGRRGTATLREARDTGIEPALTRSELEDRFLTFLDARGLPRPEVNVDLQLAGRWIQPDFLWRDQRLIVELDGHQTHGTRAAFERDRERDRILQADGWRVIRVTWRQLHDDPDAVARDLAGALSSAEAARYARSAGSARRA
jgi:predicted transcriptional regulator of viral defense system